jgi:hypothetical protein
MYINTLHVGLQFVTRFLIRQKSMAHSRLNSLLFWLVAAYKLEP